jgi:DNA-binding GntR family transcriptional regulator
VIELDEGELEEICKLRRTLEPVVVGWAAEKMTPEDAMRLEAQMDKVAAAADEDDVVSFFYEDLILHQMMWAVSRNRYAVRALAIVTGSLFASGLMRLRSSGALDMKREVAKHRDLMEALKSGQPQRAHDVLLGIANGFETHLKGTG